MMKRFFAFWLLVTLLFSCTETPRSKATHDKKENDGNFPGFTPTVQTETTDSNTVEILANASGQLEWISSKSRIKKGTTIYRLKNSTAFKELYKQKVALKVQLDSLITSCPSALSPVRNKWERFYVNFKLDSLTPVFPKLEYREELSHFGSDDFISSYNAIVKKEKGMKKYFGQASQNMHEIQWFKKAGDKITKGEKIGVAKK